MLDFMSVVAFALLLVTDNNLQIVPYGIERNDDSFDRNKLDFHKSEQNILL